MASFLLGASGFFVFAVIAPVLIRACARISPVLIHGAIAVGLLVAMAVAGMAAVPAFKFWHAAAVYGLLVMGYVFAFGTVYKSVSLNLLIELAATRDRMPNATFVRRIDDLFAGRAGILVEMGHAQRLDSGFAATPPGRTVAGCVAGLQRLFRIETAGLYGLANPAPAARAGSER